ncbi:adenosine deaminase [Acidithiobacillus concretivorus]|uniref:Adenine deaminase n=1 Tax=Acidithiobacillus concretivorus TaxID=3063952 RepID=A0ABS5ZTU9_9PROT|nr:adenosine deaminase [Acidithiobacillus concretivorus]MBU2740064.1 adenosine deaminase [Acidithiobacillus concretivorus]
MNYDLNSKKVLADFVRDLPKVELHLHIEGTLEPELLLSLAERHRIAMPYANIEMARAAYEFDDLQSFLNVYYLGTSVLREERDFYELTQAYMQRCKQQHIIHTEIFFDPQTHLSHGVPLDVVMGGIQSALREAELEWGISSALILCFERDREAESTVGLLEDALRIGGIAGVGLDSAELGNPPRKFQEVFKLAKSLGLHRVAHAGEEGPPDYIWEALDTLEVERIDHGVRCMEDPLLVQRLLATKIPLTVCPFSNVELKVFPDLHSHNLGDLLAAGLSATINSDDPAYFGGYLNDNIVETMDCLSLGVEDLIVLQKNAIEASFCSASRKLEMNHLLEKYIKNYTPIS